MANLPSYQEFQSDDKTQNTDNVISTVRPQSELLLSINLYKKEDFELPIYNNVGQ